MYSGRHVAELGCEPGTGLTSPLPLWALEKPLGSDSHVTLKDIWRCLESFACHMWRVMPLAPSR